MKNFKFWHKLNKKEPAQILFVFAVILVGLIAIIGLSIDLGHMYSRYARLRRAVDAAALSASSQFRKGYSVVGLVNSAQQLLDLNEITNTTSISIETCDTLPGDPMLCTTPKRKMVRVSVSQDVSMYFLSIIGIDSVPISVTTVSEAASVDLILVIDTSESMTFGDPTHIVPYGDNMRDPSQCNAADPSGSDGYPGECQPFQAVKDAATQLTNLLFDEYDRISIVTFDRYPKMELELNSDFTVVRDTLRTLSVIPSGAAICPYSTSTIPSSPAGISGSCRLYDDPSTLSGYQGLWCDAYLGSIPDPSRCTTTNIGGAMAMAGNALAGIYPASFTPVSGIIPPMREDALWAVILLTDGAANAGYDQFDFPICPDYTWGRQPFCRDLDARPSLTSSFNARHISTQITFYDADDYARDMVDFVADDQNALIYSVGLGSLVQATSTGEVTSTPPGETLLKYAAYKGFGVYYFAPGGDQLAAIFNEIGSKIATRLTR